MLSPAADILSGCTLHLRLCVGFAPLSLAFLCRQIRCDLTLQSLTIGTAISKAASGDTFPVQRFLSSSPTPCLYHRALLALLPKLSVYQRARYIHDITCVPDQLEETLRPW